MDLDLHWMQVIGGISYEAVAADPVIQYHLAGPAHQQVNPASFPQQWYRRVLATNERTRCSANSWRDRARSRRWASWLPVAAPGAAYLEANGERWRHGLGEQLTRAYS